MCASSNHTIFLITHHLSLNVFMEMHSAIIQILIYLPNPLETLICQGFPLIKCSNLM